MYYAEHRPNNDYVCSFGVSRAPSLFQFETKHERNEWVKKGNNTLIKDEWFPISSKDAAARYDLANFDDLDCSVEFGAGFGELARVRLSVTLSLGGNDEIKRRIPRIA